MRSACLWLAPLILIGFGCQQPKARRSGIMEMGPPPPGYVKIRGEAVPDWQPWHMFIAPHGATLQWHPLGPRPIVDEYWSGIDDASGRVVSIAVHPNNT